MLTHTLESASSHPEHVCELSDAQLEQVIGGMSITSFELWRCNLLNREIDFEKSDMEF